ncbi:MAG: SAM-dependent DNA methyltransferase [Lautropia sp.]|nr:MAG: SAM-dependent DNA methyltransferase [Pseudomonadota bacterium]MBC6958795.1 SAM-dependent DNA methyltransferase [Lautropia sp.]MDL1907809.1 SAM-dependent DNA methyltransferase [Betaproteobacteria bacterium PRO1]
MTTLTRELRRSLENTVRAARRTAEAGARKVIEQLAVHHHEPWPSMTPAQRELRNRLRVHGRQLGDRRDDRRGVQGIDRLTTECAYEHWHRLLFARYLAECELLIEPQSGVAISLAECEELARAEGRDWLELAADYAQRMLPQIFRYGDPVLEVALPPETRSALEDLMKALPRDVFVADDSLGWVYQYWQADRKEEVNRSEKKIGADELPAVTQLFTEDYMVLFLLHNTLGAWWAGKVLAAKPALAVSATSEGELRAACAVGDVEWTYLRFVREEGKPWRPAAGTFEGWPKASRDITLLDPCMGSGHFLVFALPMLAAMRAAEERLSAEAAIEAVLRDNLFGLEIDPRCTQIAAFNLALAAWRRIGYRQLPSLHLACSGLSLGVSKAEWLKLAERAAQALPLPPKRNLFGTEDNLFSDAMKRGFERLYDLFARAPWLGSLIDPRAAGGDLVEHSFNDLEPLLAQVMAKAETAELAEMAVAAQGLAKAAQTLAGRFTLVATNVPYLGRGKQDYVLKDYCERHHPQAKADLATCFVERCLAFCAEGGSAALVTPQNWLFLGTYKKLRKRLLEEARWEVVARLGPRAFETITGEVVNVALLALSGRRAGDGDRFAGWDASAGATPAEKNEALLSDSVRVVVQAEQLRNPDARITFDAPSALPLLGTRADAYQGLTSGDNPKFMQSFWEQQALGETWEPTQSASNVGPWSSGRELILRWEQGCGELTEVLGNGVKGRPIWGRLGVAVGQMRTLPTAPYLGTPYDMTCAVVVPAVSDDLPALWSYCSSSQFLEDVRRVDQKLNVTNATLVKVPFDLAHWKQVAAQRYPNGLPKPHSDDPTQWLFDGHPKGSDAPLQVAVVRLAGYCWPRQTGSSFPDCPALGLDGLEKHADHDGIVALNPVKGEQPAAARLLALHADAFDGEWSAAKLDGLLAQVGFTSKTLDDWLRDGFFEQHCELFHQRPFVWHIWDGRRDGFHALVNYHRLAAPNGEGRRTLEKLLYSYLGDWIDRQRADQKAGVEGADARVAAAEHLKTELTNILAGEPPYDLFVRWKPLAEQPIGWEPDINDGVRINIRPFMTAKPLGARARGACILRTTPKIKWDKDRGKEPQRAREEFPWFWGWDPDNKDDQKDFGGRGKEADGNRWNDLHYTRAFKQAARDRRKGP